MASVGLEPAVPASERPHTNALDRAATWTSGLVSHGKQFRLHIPELFSPPLYLVRLSGPPSLLVGVKEAQIMSRSIAVGMVIKIQAGRSGVRNLVSARIFPFHQSHPEQLWIPRRPLFNWLSVG